MRILYYLLFLLISIGFFSCKEKSIESEENKKEGFSIFPIFNNLDYSDTRGTVIFSATRLHQNEFSGFDYQARAQIFNNENRDSMINAGSVLVGNFNLVFDNNYQSYNEGATPNFDDTKDYFGTNVDVKILGTQQVDSATINFYSPEKIEMTLSNLAELSKSSSLNITWNTDNSNPNDVYVAVVYDGVHSNYIDSTFSDKNETIYLESTNDDGSYTIPSSVFSNLSVGSFVKVVIGRGNYKIDGNSNDKYMCISYTFDRQPLKVVN